jgi:hypothetical protein
MKSANFYTTGEGMTTLMRDLWDSNLVYAAFNCIDVPHDISLNICTGKSKLEGNTKADGQLTLSEDNACVCFTIEEQVKELEGNFIYFTDLNSALKRQMDILSSFMSAEGAEYRCGGFSRLNRPTSQYVKDRDSYNNNSYRINNALKSLGVLYPFVGKTLEDLPIDKLGGIYSSVEIEKISSTRRINEEMRKFRAEERSRKKFEKPKKQPQKNSKTLRPKPIKLPKIMPTGWLSPAGDYYCCDYHEHSLLADALEEYKIISTKGDDPGTWLENEGWIMIRYGNFIYSHRRNLKPTRKQIEVMIDHWSANPEDKCRYCYEYFDSVEDVIEYIDDKDNYNDT